MVRETNLLTGELVYSPVLILMFVTIKGDLAPTAPKEVPHTPTESTCGQGTSIWANKGVPVGSRLWVSGLETSAREASWLGGSLTASRNGG